MAASKGEARRLVQQGGVTVCGQKVADIEARFSCKDCCGEARSSKRARRSITRPCWKSSKRTFGQPAGIFRRAFCMSLSDGSLIIRFISRTAPAKELIVRNKSHIPARKRRNW
ncbi:MAG: hypothetical protein ACLTYN_12990 [Dysosmobacter welbionis]